MTREEIISGLKFTIEMFLFNPNTGEKYTEPRNDMDKTTIDACRGAIKLLEQEPCEDVISRKALIERINKAEDDFKADNMEIIASGGDSFVDGVLSAVFNIREMVRQAQSVCKSESEELNE